MINRNRLFVGSFIALVATAFGFIIRAFILGEWGREFNLSAEDLGWLAGAGLFPFAISIYLISLVIDKIGYDTAMFEVSLPVQTRGKVSIPVRGAEQIVITESGVRLWEQENLVDGVEGITGGVREGDYITFDVRSGDYRFELSSLN